MAQRDSLALAELGQRRIDVAFDDVDDRQPGRFGRVACDVAGALAVTDDPKGLRPVFLHASGPRTRQRGWKPNAFIAGTSAWRLAS
jgi:hypothetical protein